MDSSVLFSEVLSGFGLLLCLYALYVVEQRGKSRSYVPWCDLGEHASCTRAFLSPHGRIAGAHNASYGVVFYLSVFLLSAQHGFEYILILAVVAVLFSLYLAYVTYVEMKNFCLVCTAVYLLNIALLVISYRQVLPFSGRLF